MRRSILFSGLLLITIFTATVIYAVPGDLDTTFGTGGKVITNIDGNDEVKAVMIQPDGKILVAGSANSLIFVRYNADGTLDTTFGTGGKIISTDPTSTFMAGAFQPDGKLVTATATVPNPFAESKIKRFNLDGTIDTSFATNGAFTSGGGTGVTYAGVLLLPNGIIFSFGTSSFMGSTGPTMLPLSQNGTFMSASGGFDLSDARLISGAVQADGKFIIGGFRPPFGQFPGDAFVFRYNSDLTVDVTPKNLPFQPTGITPQSNGKILVTGSLNGNLAILRLDSNLNIDTTFGVNGVGIADFGSSSSGATILIQNDGSIIVGGQIGTNGGDFALVRFNSNGALDNGFGANGKVTTSFNNGEDALKLLVAIPNNKVLALGATQSTNIDFALARYLAESSTSLPSRIKFDFDGDGRSDVSVFRPSEGNWYLQQSTNGFTGLTFGFGDDIIIPADYDGDGKTDVAVFRPSNGAWYIQNSTSGFSATIFGQAGDIPVPGDFDGDNKADISVFRPSNGAWYRINSSNGSFYGLIFGQNGDIPQTADFDGDGRSDITVFRPSSNAYFYWLKSTTGEFMEIPFGFGTDIPTMADYDGDGKTDIAVFRGSNGYWYRYNSLDGQFVQIRYGQSGDIPVPADYDGNGKADIAVFRPSNGAWYFQNFAAILFGASTDKPIPSAY